MSGAAEFKRRYGPWALIIGGSEGVGAAFAQKLGALGINLVLVARNTGPLADLSSAIEAESEVEVRTVSTDLSQIDALQIILDATAGIEIGLLVCNAASGFAKGSFMDVALADITRSLRMSVLGTTALVRSFGAPMVTRGRGGIILIGSLAGNAGGPTMVLYSAGKAFAQIMAEGLWAEVKPKGVDVLYVVLGATDTPSRTRQGYGTDVGHFVADAGDMAQQALDHIADGPVLVPPHMAEAFQMFCSMPRAQAAETMAAMLAKP